MQKLSLRSVFFIGAALGFLATLAIAALGSSVFILLLPKSTLSIVVVDLVLAVIGAAVYGILGVVIFYIWSGLTPAQQFALIAVVFLIGLATFQPEIDVVALLGLILTVGGVSASKAMARRS